MQIPTSKLERFVADLVGTCTASQRQRIERGNTFSNYFNFGAADQDNAASWNKTYTYVDTLESLLYSPVSLRFHIGNPELPNILEQAKGRAAATALGNRLKSDEIDAKFSGGVNVSLVKGKGLLKCRWTGKPMGDIVQPETMGVYNEAHECLDENMEAFVHSTYINPHQFLRAIYLMSAADKESMMRKARAYQRQGLNGLMEGSEGSKTVTIGAMYPFQPFDSPTPTQGRGIVDWMESPAANLDPKVLASLFRLDELWVWDDNRQAWTTFQMIGNNMLVWGKDRLLNILAYDAKSKQEVPYLKDKHPFVEIDPNRTHGYFWGRSEIVNVALLQEALNSRFNGINRILRFEEKPSRRFLGGSGVNQQALKRYDTPGGYWTDTNPQAKVETDQRQVGGDLWESLHEYERMFDEMGGLPPIAKGRGESGVRSQGHAETLVRMASPSFKDRALTVERNCAAMGQLYLNLARAHCKTKMIAWVPEKYAGVEKKVEQDMFLVPPAPGLAPVEFSFGDLSDDMLVSVDAHSSSPVFIAEAKSEAFDLYKIGAMDAADVVEHTDAPNREELIAGIERRGAEKAAAISQLEERQQLKLLQGSGKKPG